MCVKFPMDLEQFEVTFFFLGKIKLCSFFPGPLLNYIKNFFIIIEEIRKSLHLVKLYNLGQNPYGRRLISSSILGDFFVKRGSDLKKVLQSAE